MHYCRLAFLCIFGVYLCTKVILHGQISLHNSSWPSMTATGCEILLHVILYLARSQYISQEKGVDLEFPCFVRLPVVFFECYLKLLLCFMDVEKPNHFPTRALPWTSQTPRCIMHMFHAHVIWVPSGLPMSTFFSVLTPGGAN